MTVKQKVLKEINTLPEDILSKVYEFLHALKSDKGKQHRIRSFKLQGQFDKMNLRKEAYE